MEERRGGTLVLKGRPVADMIYGRLRNYFQAWIQSQGLKPTLHITLVGNHPAQRRFVQQKIRVAEELGLQARFFHYTQDQNWQSFLREWLPQVEDPSVHGVILQWPLPPQWPVDRIWEKIPPQKDLDALNPLNVARWTLWPQKAVVLPATARAIEALLDFYQITLPGRRVMVLGRSPIVGLPTALLLQARQAAVSLWHSQASPKAHEIAQHDIVVVAVGKAHFWGPEGFEPHQTVIDVGMHAHDSGWVGDVDAAQLWGRVQALTPVPGGVGPLTVAMVMDNLARLLDHWHSFPH